MAQPANYKRSAPPPSAEAASCHAGRPLPDGLSHSTSPSTAMKRTASLIRLGCLPLFLLALSLFSPAAQANAAEKSAKLPGARSAVDASDYATLQAALDAVHESGGLVRLPAGTFEIDEPLVISRGDVLVQGAGTATHIVNNNQDGKPAIILQHPEGMEVANADRLWRIMLSNFRVTGNPNSGDGIVARKIQEVFLQGVTVSEHGGDGIRLDHCYEDPRVNDCLITYNKQTGLNLLGCHDIVVSGNQFEENQDAVHCIDGYNLCMTGNCLDDHLGKGVVIENTYGSVVSGNMIEECNAAALVMDRNCYGNTVSANVIAHNGSGVELLDAHGCSVSANTFTLMKSDALRITSASGRITVTGNNFSSSYIGDDQDKRAEGDRTAAGITLEGAQHVAISGNVFAGLRPKALELKGEDSSGISFDANVIVDSPSDHQELK